MQYTERRMDINVMGFCWMVMIFVNDCMEMILHLHFDDLGCPVSLSASRIIFSSSSSRQVSVR
jgi:citrate synthase